jgi:hypothetical protein
MTSEKIKINKILLQKQNKNIIKYVLEIGVEHIKGNEKLYFYLYLLGT